MWFKEKKYAWFILIFLWVFGFIGSLGRFVAAYYQQEIASFLDVGRGFLGFTWSTSIFIGAICAPIGGWLTDRFGYKKVLIVSGILGTLSTTLFLFTRNPIGYYCGFGLLSGLAGIGASTSYVLVNNWFVHHRAKALVVLGSAGSLGLAIITPIFVSNKTWLDWNNAYWIMFTMGCVFIPLAIVYVRDNRDTADIKKAEKVSEIDGTSSSDKDNLTLNTKNGAPVIPSRKLTTIMQYMRNPVMATVIC
ncbi:MAG: transporter, partial [Cohnella sp.]|nr:transporter [Cohnella sp.]